MQRCDVAVLGAGPAGLAAALAAKAQGAGALLIEREDRPGGILKQCIHDGFGLIRFGEKLTGPEYAQRCLDMIYQAGIPLLTNTFASQIIKKGEIFDLTLTNADRGVFHVEAASLILAGGCRERTAKQVFIHGSRPAGVMTAGAAQYFVNIQGYLPCKRCVVLGSGDIGLIMARRLTLEGAQVLGVYEAKPEPSGLSRNIAQCLNDFGIPLHLSRTVTRVFGSERVEAVEISAVDADMQPIPGTETRVECDGVILSVGLIPENEPAEALGIELDRATRGPVVDQNGMTLLPGAFSCGNALHVSDLVDYVSESGDTAGRAAAAYRPGKARKLVPVGAEADSFLYTVPQRIDAASENLKPVFYFRSKNTERNARVQLVCGNRVLFDKKYSVLRPPEMERVQADLTGADLSGGLRWTMQRGAK
jgi:NADPH-dependent 2,4-dienoyl-CoA reductase/sulfur reductase-like enzyme